MRLKIFVGLTFALAFLCLPSHASAADTVVNTLTGTLNNPFDAVAIGNKLYVSNNFGNAVTVFNTLTGTSTNIAVGNAPEYMAVVGTKIYVTNSGASTVSVIDSTTDTVSATINISSWPGHIFAYQGFVYVAYNYSGLITVINSTTDTTVTNIIAGANAMSSFVALSTNFYVAVAGVS